MEEWRPVVGYEGLYEVSDHGRVRSVDREFRRVDGAMYRRRGVVRSTTVHRLGYLNVELSKYGRKSKVYVHRLVAAAFIGPCPNGMEVRHRAGDPSDNRAWMLEYGTHSENMRDRARHGTDHNAIKTHCPHGHPYNPENTCHKNGRRHCRECARLYARKYRADGRRVRK